MTCRRPYAGWEEFGRKIRDLVAFLKEVGKTDAGLKGTGLIKKPERFSLKFINMIGKGDQSDLGLLNASMNLGGIDLKNSPLNLRTELTADEFITIVQIATHAEINIPPVPCGVQTQSLPESPSLEDSLPEQGLLIDIDTIYSGDFNENWEPLETYLEKSHDISKELFFCLLTADAAEAHPPLD